MNINLKKKLPFFLFLIFCIYYTVVLTNYSWHRLNIFEQEGDLAAYDNAIYNTAQGKIMQSTVTASVYNFWPIASGLRKPDLDKTEFSMFGIHFIPTIALTNSLPYLIYPSAKTTLLMQVLAIALSAYLIFYFLYLNQINVFLSLGAAVAYLLHPATIGALANAYHPVLMAPVFLMAMLVCYKLKYWKTYILMAILACGVQENVILSVFAMSILFLLDKKYKSSAIHLVTSFIIFIFVTKYAIPYFNPDGALPYGNAYGSPLGDSMSDIVINGLTKPALLFQTFFTQEKIAWLLMLGATFIFLPLLSPIYLFIAVIGIGPNLVSNNKAMLLMWGQYNALAMPFLAVAAAFGFKNLLFVLNKLKFLKSYKLQMAWAYPIVGLAFILGAIHYWKKASIAVPGINPDRILKGDWTEEFYSPRYVQFKEIADRIDKNLCLSAPDEFLSQLHQRELSFIFPVHFNKCEQFIVQKAHPYIPKERIAQFLQIAQTAGYKMEYENDLFQLYKK